MNLYTSTSGFSLIILLSLCSFNLSAQSLISQLNGVKTNFIITSDGHMLNNTEQVIIHRPVFQSVYNDRYDTGYGFAYAYQSYHLEFRADQSILKKERKEKGNRYSIYQVRLFDANEEILATIEIPWERVNRVSQVSQTSISRSGKAGGGVEVSNSKVVQITTSKEVKQEENHTYFIDLVDIPYILLDQTKRFDIIYYDIL